MTSFATSVGSPSSTDVGNTFCAVRTFDTSASTASLISCQTASGQSTEFAIFLSN